MSQGKRRAIIDIGSNSIRLVVYGGAPRAPITLYNEKLSAGLGRGVVATGILDEEASQAGLKALARFAALVDLMQVDSLQVAATAAVREASNGQAFLEQIRGLGLPVELLDGDQEAVASGYGVISAIRGADGVAADLGGGSLELVRVKDGSVHDRVSLPLGILRIALIRGRGAGKLTKYVQKQLAAFDWLQEAQGLPLYLVGGSWRALTRLHIHVTEFPLPVISNHEMPLDAGDLLAKKLQEMDRDTLKQVPRLPSSRIPMLADAAALLRALGQILYPSHFVTCASGLREGLLYQSLSPPQQNEDPLIAGAHFTADQHQRFPGYGTALAQWLSGIFGDEGDEYTRLRHATCLLADLGWTSNPEFRAISGEELALHGNWVGVNASDRVILATALFASFGGGANNIGLLEKLAPPAKLAMARCWGLAIRIAHRLGGGAADALIQCPLNQVDGHLLLHIKPNLIALDNGSVRRRLERLGDAMGLKSEIIAN